VSVTAVLNDRRNADHEAAHVAAILVAGLPPPLIVRTDHPRPDLAGLMRLDWDHLDPDDPVVLRALVVALLAGAGAEGFHAEILDWPPECGDWPDSAAKDVQQVVHLVERLGIDQIRWGQLCYRAAELWRDTTFKTVFVAVRDQLLEKEFLTGDEIRKIAADALGDQP
jgi:hypothetical protein